MDDNNGWIKIHRCIVKHWIWENADYLRWWLDLLLYAEYEDKKRLTSRSKLVQVKRGQVLVSIRGLKRRWARKDEEENIITPSVHTVLRFLRLLEEDGMITRTLGEHQTSLITICNYARYQVTSNADSNAHSNAHSNADSNADSNAPLIKNIRNEETKEIQEVTGARARSSKFVAPTFEEVQAYINEKQYNFDAAHFIDYYTSNGWRVGKNPMKDWKAAVRNWARSEHRNQQPNKQPYGNTFGNNPDVEKAKRDAEWAEYVTETLNNPNDDNDKDSLPFD